jgi:hypothetical protein
VALRMTACATNAGRSGRVEDGREH